MSDEDRHALEFAALRSILGPPTRMRWGWSSTSLHWDRFVVCVTPLPNHDHWDFWNGTRWVTAEFSEILRSAEEYTDER